MQLPLDLSGPPRFRRADFTAAPANALALATLDRWPDWPDRVLLLAGPAGAGKSHLAAIWAERAGARMLDVGDLLAPDLPARIGRAALLENADALVDHEAALFHLLNIVREEKADLLVTARLPPDRWGIRTADLVSRLRLAPTVWLQPPDDDLMRHVLRKLFADRQLVVDDGVIAYLVLHLARSLAAARAVVDEVDRLSLALGRRVTRRMAAGVLGRQAENDNFEGDEI